MRSDQELIQEVLSGVQASYAELVRRHQRFVFTLALRFARKREDAEEIAQDCFVKAYRSLHTFKRTAKFTTWLYSIVYTTSMTFLRKKQLDTHSIDDTTQDTGAWEIASFDADITEQRSRSVYVNQAIGQLLPDDRAIITLFYLGELSLEEIAETLNIETNTAKVKLHRARQRLRTRLGQLLKHEVNELL
ncbi:RNA polymerase sigma factor [Hufsiella ginkgonis]|uniref:Sigma-70 family RNA polymerase sigma factor n=1 Tax=Hufsiella ginkgonis TaxID=2695274 RepID=A0A7K1XVM4_9SPHI|nr:sigma-70 family RNA polymerase sigma factor [Hufsiella ginkgonis]MXV14858.1 sigma-70 family RNA polymerase sigma factor [Hufsiella ginkgonis]